MAERLIENLRAGGGGLFLILLDAAGTVEKYTYADVLSRAADWSLFYGARGLSRGDRVVIILQHSLDLYASFLGALMGGQIPALHSFPSVKYSQEAYFEAIARLVGNASPRLIVTYDNLRERFRKTRTVFPGSPDLAVPADVPAGSARGFTPVSAGGGEIAFLQYSSGTTGLKKGVAISHQALLWQIDEYARAIGLSQKDTIVSWLPLYHDMGLIACFLLPLLKGIKLVAMSSFDWVKRPVMFLEAVSTYRGTLAWLPNFAFNFLAVSASESDTAPLDLSCLRGLVNCSEPILARSHAVFTERFSKNGFKPEALAASFAMAENTFAVTSGGFGQVLAEDAVDSRSLAAGFASPVKRGSPESRILVSSGRAMPGIFLKILAEDGSLMADRRVGEIVVQSPCLLSEYFHNPAETKKSLRGGCLYTGDLGYMAGGELFVTGRKKDMIIINGHNIYPQDIESLVNQIPGVHPGRCVALGVQNPSTGSENLVVLAESKEKKDLHEKISTDIFKIVSEGIGVPPTDVRVVDPLWLKKSTSGKIARAANAEKYKEFFLKMPAAALPGTREDESSPPVFGVDDVKRCVKEVIFRNPSGRRRALDLDEPLISSGLIDSLDMVDVIVRLEKVANVSIPSSSLVDVSRWDTVARMTATVQEIAAGLGIDDEIPAPRSMEEIELQLPSSTPSSQHAGLWSLFYRAFFAWKGVHCGKNLHVFGPLILRLGEHPKNLTIGDNVTLMPWVDIKLREAGRIVLGKGVTLDTSVRLVAAQNACLRLGDGVKIGMGTIFNAGADVVVGRQTLMGGYCTINSSKHRFNGRAPVASQELDHQPVYIGEESWLGAQVIVEPGSRIGKGSVVGAQSFVVGDLPAYSVSTGHPARVVRGRSAEKKS